MTTLASSVSKASSLLMMLEAKFTIVVCLYYRPPASGNILEWEIGVQCISRGQGKLKCFQNAQHNDIQRNDIQHNDTQHNNIQLNDTQHSIKVIATLSLMTLNTLCWCHLCWVSQIRPLCWVSLAECRGAVTSPKLAWASQGGIIPVPNYRCFFNKLWQSKYCLLRQWDIGR